MTKQGGPGWYPDGTGQQRWWDGRGWTGYTQSDSAGRAPEPAETLEAPVPAVPANPALQSRLEARPARRRLPNRVAAVLTSAALIVGVILGSAIGGGAEANSADTAKLTATVTGLQTDLRSTTRERDSLKSAAADVASQAKTLDDQKTVLEDEATALAKRSEKLDRREKKVAKRESAVKHEAAAGIVGSGSSGGAGASPTTSHAAPGGATAQCSDGSYSYSAHRSGTCSHHGGVATWL